MALHDVLTVIIFFMIVEFTNSEMVCLNLINFKLRMNTTVSYQLLHVFEFATLGISVLILKGVRERYLN